ncbi:MAG: hypothetical protein L6R37_003640, partial [Teloschistes peruensis]
MDHIDTSSHVDSTSGETHAQQQAEAAQVEFIRANPAQVRKEIERLHEALRQANITPTSPVQPLSPPLPDPPTTGSDFASAIAIALPDIPECDGERDRLDAWEQSLIQKMTANDDCFPKENNKIAYAESRLAFGKKANSLMRQYRSDGICTLATLADWRQKLRALCGNPFEEEDARTYLRDELKQGTMPFHEYYHKFCQKKERSRMEGPSLLDCLKRNVNYAVQAAAFTWRDIHGRSPVTFQDHVEAFSDVDAKIAQLKHGQPRSASTAGATNPPRPKPSLSQSVPLSGSKSAPVVPVVAVTPVPSDIPVGDPMDLSSAITAVQGKPL